MPDAVVHFAVDHLWDDVCLLALLFSKPPRPHQRHLDTTPWIWASDRSSPNPCNNRNFGPVWQCGVWVEVANSLLGLVSHPLPIGANVGSEPLRVLPRAD